LRPDVASQLASGIWAEASAGDYAALYINGRHFASTGTTTGGPSDHTLCSGRRFANDTAATFECPTSGWGSSTLLCAPNTPSSCGFGGGDPAIAAGATTRANLNARMLGAAIVARWLGQRSLDRFTLPWFDDASPSGALASFTSWYEAPGLQLLSRPGTGTRSAWLGSCVVGANSGRPWHFIDRFTTPATEFNPYGLAFGNGSCASPIGKPILFWAAPASGERRYRPVSDELSVSSTNATRWAAHDFLTRMVASTDVTSPTEPLGDAKDGYARLQTWPLPWDDEPYVSMYVRGSIGDQGTVARETLFDAMELLCAADMRAAVDSPCGELSISGAGDLESAARQIQCFADSVREQAGKTIFVDVPSAAIDALRDQSPLGATTQIGGDSAEEIAELRQAMVRIYRASSDIVYHADSMSRRIRDARLQLQSLGLQQNMARNSMIAEVANAAASCASSGGLEAWKTAATCANSVVQIGTAVANYRIGQKLNDNDEARVLIALEQEAADRGQAMHDIATTLTTNSDVIDASLERLNQVRMQARRLLRKAFQLESDAAGNVLASQVISRQHFNTQNVRYQRAFDHALQMAHLAKRAVEQRFAVRLIDIESNLAYVDAPSEWEGRLCTMTGLNYERLRQSGRDLDADYAGEYVGDYVQRLENFVLSYAQDYNSSTGSDVAVVSLRDDILNVRDLCPSRVSNLLGSSAAFDVTSVDGTAGGWMPGNCIDATGTGVVVNCVEAKALEESWPASLLGMSSTSELGSPRPYRITFGPPDARCYPVRTSSCPCVESTCSWQADSYLGQRVHLEPGRYRLSYFSRPSDLGERTFQSAYGVGIRLAGSSEFFRLGDLTYNEDVDVAAGAWSHLAYTVSVSTAGEYEVYFRNLATYDSQTPFGYGFDVAGVALERFPADLPNDLPTAFAATQEPGKRLLPVCEDTDGDRFRSAGWERVCETECPSGRGDTCPDSEKRQVCYQQIQFTLTNEALESGAVLRNAGFAQGNFNYRTNTVAVNFVGTGARTCANTQLPSTCYNAGYLLYSLAHNGPFAVRSYDGSLFDANLFPGRIVNASGLAAERYVTDPISGSDQQLLGQFTRSEFQGRPMTGSYVLRVREDAALNFAGIEDIQLVFDYRYWTRNR